MLKMFRKRRAPENEHPQMDKIAVFLAKAINGVQTRLANWLSRQEQNLTIKQKKIALLIFCICMSAVAGSFLYRGLFIHSLHAPEWLRQQSIILPKTHSLPDSIDLKMLQELESKQKAEQSKTDSIHY